MKEVYVGNFDIGYEGVDLFITDAGGGEFITNPKAVLKVGVGSPDWPFVYQVILHEALEYSLFRMQSRFSPDNDLSGDTGAFVFIMDHARFSNICGRTSLFMVDAVPIIHRTWSTFHNPKTKGKLTVK